MPKIRLPLFIKKDKLGWYGGIALVLISCLVLLFSGVRKQGTAAAFEIKATFQNLSAQKSAFGLLEAAGISEAISPKNITIPFSDFSKVTIVSLDDALSRSIPGDPRYSPLLESLSAYFNPKDVSGNSPSIYFASLSNSRKLETRRALDSGGLAYDWSESKTRHFGFLWIFSLAFSVYSILSFRVVHDLIFRILLAIPWILFTMLVPNLMGLSISMLGCTVSLSIFILHKPVKNTKEKYVLSGFNLSRFFIEAGLYCIPVAVFLFIEKAIIPYFLAVAFVESLLFQYLDFFIGPFRKKLCHEPPVFQLIITKPHAQIKNLNYGITCSSALVLLLGLFMNPGSGLNIRDSANVAGLQGKGTPISYRQLYEHAELQYSITYNRYGKPSGDNSSFSVFSRDSKNSGLVKIEQKIADGKETILRSIQDSSCLQIIETKKNLSAIIGKPLVFHQIPLDKGYLLVYILAFIPIFLSNFRENPGLRKLYFTKTNIRQEA